ncbi:MAG: glucose-1-phosphate cytidylyltransferase [Ectothiorhodospiraceae bacterium]|nr:glucose-1-phosphate cytidylyltransferase [Ectothiorhodospiraceae bacterium]
MEPKPKVVILCGGKGIRLSAFADNTPKPLVPVGEKPILWHVMKLYSYYGFRDFVLALGYKGDLIVEYFERYKQLNCDYTMTMDQSKGRDFHTSLPPDEQEWRITFAHTGEETQTGGRIKRIARYVEGDTFLCTYADGVSNVNIDEVFRQHCSGPQDLTMVTVMLKSGYGLVASENGVATGFKEKPDRSVRINGGFFVCDRKVFDAIDSDETAFEEEPMEGLVREGRVGVHPHDGFWQCMDTPKDYIKLNELWEQGNPPWKIWD